MHLSAGAYMILQTANCSMMRAVNPATEQVNMKFERVETLVIGTLALVHCFDTVSLKPEKK